MHAAACPEYVQTLGLASLVQHKVTLIKQAKQDHAKSDGDNGVQVVLVTSQKLYKNIPDLSFY